MKVNYVIPGNMAKCPVAIDSVDFNGLAQFDAQTAGIEGSTPLILGTIAPDAFAPRGGELVIEGCRDVLLTANVIIGEDCDGCTSDVLTTVPKTYLFKAAPGGGTISYELPEVFFAGDIQLL